MTLRKVAITGFPGWLTVAMLEERATAALSIDELVLFAHPSQVAAAQHAAARLSTRSTVAPLELGPAFAAPPLNEVDTLIHTAGVIHVGHTRDWYDVNTQGTIALAQHARAAGVRRFVFISSIAAAGISVPGRDLVETDPAKPLHHYGRSKLLAERALLGLQQPGTFEVVILRPSMFYGPPVPARHIDIYRRILTGRMPLVGGGNYNRSLVYIDNLVQLVWLAAESERAAGETYFAVDKPVYTTRSIVDAMAEALGVRARYWHIPELAARAAYQVDRAISAFQVYVAPIHLAGEAHWHQSADCGKAIRELGYAPSIELRDGMRRAIAWCRETSRL